MRKSSFLYCLIIAAFVFVVFRDSLAFTVTGDAAGWLHRYQFSKGSLLAHKTNALHYCPLSILWYGFPLSLFGFQPFWTHLHSLLIHSANSILVFLLARIFLGRMSYALAAAVLFSTGIYVPETACWGGGFPNLAMTLFFFLCFFLLRTYLLRASLAILVVFNTVFAISLFIFPTAMNCIIIFLLYLGFDPEGIRANGEGRGRGFPLMLKVLVPPALSIIIFLVIRSFFIEGMTYNSLNPLSPETYWGVSGRMFHGLKILVIPSQFIRAFFPGSILNLPGGYTTLEVLFMLAIGGVMLFRASRRDKFLLSWLVAHIFLISLETDVGLRHLYSVSIGSSIMFLAAIDKIIKGIISGMEKVSTFSSHAQAAFPPRAITTVSVLLMVCILYVPVKNNLSNVKFFLMGQEKASRIVRSSVEHVRSSYPKPSRDKIIYLINMPYALWRPGGLSTFVLPSASLLYLLDLESGTKGWTSNYSIGMCEGLYVAPQGSWQLFNEIKQPRKGQAIKKYATEELLVAAEGGAPVFVFDYMLEHPVLLTKEWAEENARALEE